ncbi:TIGR02646 family protein [Aphanizomenon sp. PH219]|nr:TIGR02646 family protein [Aphanizomenon sp. 202]MDK2459443.1 TIGR02646 family protein [Aphanizomenon sp. PH219]
MKYINKSKPPRLIEVWFRKQPKGEDGYRLNCVYREMPKKDTVKAKLLKEQGGLCCYTGIRIDKDSSHIEHFKPQTLCKKESNYEDIDYNNLLAAYPDKDAPRCEFGAHNKDDWYDEELLISPLHRQCETRFTFDEFGDIGAAQDDDTGAIQTIKNLRLDHSILQTLRLKAIEEVLYPDDQELSEAQLRRIVESNYSHKDKKGRYPEFCFVIEQVARKLLLKKEKNRKRREAIQKQSNSNK